MPKAYFSIYIEPAELKKYYSGHAQSVVARSTRGIRVQFPANLLLPYVTHNGIKGQFELEYDENGKAIGLTRL